MKNLKWILYGAVGLFIIYSIFSNSDDDSYETQEVLTPSEGVITTVKEIQENEFKIEDEQSVPSPSDSRIIAKNLDNTIDTFTLEEAKLISENESSRGGSIYRAASYGFFGYMIGRSMGSFRPSPGAYVDQRTYDNVNNRTGQRMQSTAKRTTVSRPKSGFGGNSSTRSHGG